MFLGEVYVSIMQFAQCLLFAAVPTRAFEPTRAAPLAKYGASQLVNCGASQPVHCGNYSVVHADSTANRTGWETVFLGTLRSSVWQ